MAKLSDYVIRFLADEGIRHVFLVTGGGAMHLDESLAREASLEPICNSHEQASAICAEIYGKTTNNLGAAIVTTGPGGTNAVTGVAGAWLDSTPCIYISGQVKRPDRMFDALGSLGLHFGYADHGVHILLGVVFLVGGFLTKPVVTTAD